MRTDRLVLNSFFAVLIGGIASAQSGGNFVIKDATLEGSGHANSSGNFVSEIRLGQALAGQSMSGGAFAVGSGIFPAPPTAPADLSVVAPSATMVSLSWTDTSNNEEGFRIERCVMKGRRCSAFSSVGTVGPDVISFDDLTVTKNTIYQYQLVAFNAAGESAASDSVTLKTPRK